MVGVDGHRDLPGEHLVSPWSVVQVPLEIEKLVTAPLRRCLLEGRSPVREDEAEFLGLAREVLSLHPAEPGQGLLDGGILEDHPLLVNGVGGRCKGHHRKEVVLP